ncbi:MAG: hypothetical protein HC779_06745 [Phyllobacteriaceae bacterium]|nr:hypothetical protein [Phyllobacteriaceae bacterium]
MSDQPNSSRNSNVVPLDEAIREVRTFLADRSDVVVDLREAARARMELLAAELGPTIAAVPAGDDQFDFALSSGQNPRLFIDAVAHVDLGRDRMTYRLVRDTRNGRVVMEESRDLKTVADAATRYVAERIVERQRAMEGDVRPLGVPAAAPTSSAHENVSDFVLGLVWFLIGAVAGAGLLYLWVSGALPFSA